MPVKRLTTIRCGHLPKTYPCKLPQGEGTFGSPLPLGEGLGVRAYFHGSKGLTPDSLPSSSLVGLTLGKYELTELLGTGGMAEVYRAVQTQLDRTVAIKVMHPHLARVTDFKRRFLREAKAMASLRHPNIIQIYDFDEQDGWYYMVMEYAPYGTLTETLFKLHSRGEIMPLPKIADLMTKIGSALDYAHQAGMVHRDIKPTNIMFTEPDEPVLTDFGIARLAGGTKLTRTGSTVGTPAYMSPEQAQGASGDARSDIYSLGIMLYEMTTGSLPYDADTPFGVIMKHVNEPLPHPRRRNPDLPAAVVHVLNKALAKDPDKRYQTAAAMSATLNRIVNQADTKVVPTPVDTQLYDEDSTNFTVPRPAMPPPAAPPAMPPPPAAQPASVPDQPAPAPTPGPVAGLPNLPWYLVGGAAVVLLLLLAGVFLLFGALRGGGDDAPSITPTATGLIAAAATEATATMPAPPPTDSSTTPLEPTTTPTEIAQSTATETENGGGQINETILISPTPSPSPVSPSPTATTEPTATPTVVPSPSATPVVAVDPASLLSGRLLYVSDRDGDFEIYLKYLGQDRPDEQLTANSGIDDWFPDWGPDGRILFTSNRRGNYDLYSANADGTNPQPLVITAAWDEYGNWSGDSGRVVFSSTAKTNGQDNAELFRFDGSGDPVRLTENSGEDRNPEWHPSGDIYYASNYEGDWEIYVLSEEGQPRNLTNAPATVDEDPTLSPDFSQILFIRKDADTNGDGQVGDGDTGNVYLMNIDGSNVQPVTTDNRSSSPAWSPDGAWALYARTVAAGEETSNLYATRLADGETVQITDDAAARNWGGAWTD